MENQPIIRLENITKTFGKVVANRNVSMDIQRGEILSVLGENGCGKTTLMNMIAGIYYLNLHRRCSPFCGIFMEEKEGRDRIKETVRSIIRILYRHKEEKERQQRQLESIAERLRKKGMSEEDIRECLMGE